MRGRTARVTGEGASTWTSAGATWAPLLLPALPPEVPFGVLGRVLGPRGSSEGWFECLRLEPGRALELLQRARTVAEAELASEAPRGGSPEGPELERIARSARELAERVGGREQELWRVGLTLSGRGRSTRAAIRARAVLAERLGALGFRTRPPEFEVRGALEPAKGEGGETRPRGYFHTLHTDGLAAFFPFGEESVLEPGGVLVGLLLEDAGPVVIDPWRHPSHSWGIFGTTGAGKSFAAALLALRSRWADPDLELTVLDPLGEFGGLATALGGAVLEVGPGSASHLNPLDPASTGGDRTEKTGRVGALLRALFPSLLDEEAALLDGALHALFAGGPEVPTFRDLAGVVAERAPPGSRLPMLLQVLTHGSLAYLDRPSNVELGANPLVITFRGVPDPQLPFHLAYALEAACGRLRTGGRRRLLILDEAHVLVRHPATAEFLDGLVRHLRHYSAGAMLLTQHPEDFLRSESGRSLLRNLRATLLLRLGEVSEATREFFRLTPAEAEWLSRARLPREAGYSEGLLRIGPAHLPLAVVASSPEHQFLTGALRGPGTSSETDSGPTAGLSDRDGRNGSDDRRAGAVGRGSSRTP